MNANYSLIVNSQILQCDDLDKTLAQVNEAIERGYLCLSDTLYVKLGAGSVIALVSKEALQGKRQEKLAMLQRAQGLIVPGRDTNKQEWPFRLAVKFAAGGEQQQLEPVPYETREAAQAAAERAMRGEVIHQVVDEGHDYIWIYPGPGVVCFVLSKEEADQVRRLAVQQAQARAVAQQQPGGAPPKKIII